MIFTFSPAANLPYALAYHKLGLSIFPVKPRSKEPAVAAWKQWQRQQPDEQQVRDWFADTACDQLGIAIVGGSVSGGLLIRDFDREASYDAWRASHRPLAETVPTVRTPRGCHVYARCDGYKPDGAKTFIRNYGDGELRGDGSYVVAPPSTHPSGNTYSWSAGIPKRIPLVAFESFDIKSLDVTQEIEFLCNIAGGLSDDVRAAIMATRPLDYGQRHRQLFQFARRLRCLSQYRDCDDPLRLRPLVEAWYQVALPTIRTKDFDATLAEFVRGWPLVRYASGDGSLQAALLRARSKALPPESASYVAEKALLLALCRELQIERGARAFYLSARDAASAIGLTGRNDHIKAHRWLKEFVGAGLLTLESVGSQVRRRANEYRYLSEWS